MKQVPVEFLPGDKVYDDLTSQEATVVGISLHMGRCTGREHCGVAIGYWVDNDVVEGGRHPWELSAITTGEQ